MGGISEEAIRERAYHIWVREGCPHGRDHEHWVRAQVEIEAEARGGNGARPKAKPAATARKAPAAKAPATKAPAKPKATAPAKAATRKPAKKS
jgi:hypothetical protein